VFKAIHVTAALRCLPFLIGPAYLTFVLWFQPGDQLGVPEDPPWLGRLVYDDWDVAAMALRGVNAQLGRRAGRVDAPAEVSWSEYHSALAEPHSFRPTYYLEYPHACLLLFRLGYVWQSDFEPPPASVCDGAYPQVAAFVPRDDHERQLWRQFRRATQTYLVFFIACQLALLFVLQKGYESADGPGPIWLCILPAAMYFTLNRFDILPALLTGLSLLALGRKWFISSAVLLAAATAIKVYPVLLVPLVARYLWDRREGSGTAAAALPARWLLVYGATIAAFFLPVILFSGWESFWGPYQFQLNREPMGPMLYGSVLPYSWATNDTGKAFRMGAVLLTTLLLMLGRMDGLDGLLRRGAIALIVFISLPVFYSPQWIVWFLPFVVPLARGQRWLLLPWVVLDLITYLTFPVYFDGKLADYVQWINADIWAGWTIDDRNNLLGPILTTVRYICLTVLLLMLAWREFRPGVALGEGPEPEPAPAA
jgi:hypothetical protein